MGHVNQNVDFFYLNKKTRTYGPDFFFWRLAKSLALDKMKILSNNIDMLL
jgi:hypothetical protein